MRIVLLLLFPTVPISGVSQDVPTDHYGRPLNIFKYDQELSSVW